METKQKNQLFLLSTAILIVLHTAGIIGLHTNYKMIFLLCTPFNLLFSACLLILNHKQPNLPLLIFLVLLFLLGISIEAIGVRTQVFFGAYNYENSPLGLQMFHIPIIIGVNWVILIYCTGIIGNKFHCNIFVKSLIGAVLMVILDLVIEPVAIRYGLWTWVEGYVPIRNYIAWFIFSFVFLLGFHSFKFDKENKLAVVLLSIQFLFFAILNIY